MLKIVRVSLAQFGELISRLRAEGRVVMERFPANNLYIQSCRTLVVVSDEVECVDFPLHENPTMANVLDSVKWNDGSGA